MESLVKKTGVRKTLFDQLKNIFLVKTWSVKSRVMECTKCIFFCKLCFVSNYVKKEKDKNVFKSNKMLKHLQKFCLHELCVRVWRHKKIFHECKRKKDGYTFVTEESFLFLGFVCFTTFIITLYPKLIRLTWSNKKGSFLMRLNNDL